MEFRLFKMPLELTRCEHKPELSRNNFYFVRSSRGQISRFEFHEKIYPGQSHVSLEWWGWGWGGPPGPLSLDRPYPLVSPWFRMHFCLEMMKTNRNCNFSVFIFWGCLGLSGGCFEKMAERSCRRSASGGGGGLAENQNCFIG